MFDDLQNADIEKLAEYFSKFLLSFSKERRMGRVCPQDVRDAVGEIGMECLPEKGTPIEELFSLLDKLIVPNIVKNSHPLFLAYVTPPALDIASIGEAVASILNQNIMFNSTSPIGTCLEQTVVDWLCEICGYEGKRRGGILTSGGSEANLYGLAVARRFKLGKTCVHSGNRAAPAQMKVYCSTQMHHSVHKAAIILGLGKDSVVSIESDDNHRIKIDKLKAEIKKDENAGNLPIAVFGSAGTRHCCAFDDLKALADVAKNHKLWFHVDAAYGGFLRIADNPPEHANELDLGDSITLDPHKLLFVPFDCGGFLIKDKNYLLQTFGGEGEYHYLEDPTMTDFCDLGLQLGRSFKALKVWLALKYIGVERYSQEFSRLLDLTRYFVNLVQNASDSRMELLGPATGTAVCFRWCYAPSRRGYDLDGINSSIRNELLQEGFAFIDEVKLSGHTGMRICLTNFRTEETHLFELFKRLISAAEARI